MADSSPRDLAAWGILASNVAALVVAWVQHWDLLTLLWPYFFQNLIIGGYSFRRLRALNRFTSKGLRINGQAVPATVETRNYVAGFFLLHFGGFHLGYLVFLISFAAAGLSDADAGAVPSDPASALLMLLLVIGFLLSHGFSHREHVAADLARVPNIGTLMFMPYMRVVPMHLTIICFLALGDVGGLLLFGVLKTAADIGMHKLEHRWLQKSRREPAT